MDVAASEHMVEKQQKMLRTAKSQIAQLVSDFLKRGTQGHGR